MVLSFTQSYCTEHNRVVVVVTYYCPYPFTLQGLHYFSVDRTRCLFDKCSINTPWTICEHYFWLAIHSRQLKLAFRVVLSVNDLTLIECLGCVTNLPSICFDCLWFKLNGLKLSQTRESIVPTCPRLSAQPVLPTTPLALLLIPLPPLLTLQMVNTTPCVPYASSSTRKSTPSWPKTSKPNDSKPCSHKPEPPCKSSKKL